MAFNELSIDFFDCQEIWKEMDFRTLSLTLRINLFFYVFLIEKFKTWSLGRFCVSIIFSQACLKQPSGFQIF